LKTDHDTYLPPHPVERLPQRDQMKIVHYLNHTRQANGHVAVAVDLACAHAAMGHDVYLVSGRGDFDDVLARNGVTKIPVPDVSGFFPLRLLSMVRSLMPVMRRIRPDVVNAHMVAAAIAARLVAWNAGYKLVTTVHNSFDKQAPLMRVGDRVIAISKSVYDEMRGFGVAAGKLRIVHNGTIGGARRPAVPVQRMTLSHPAIATVCGLHPRKGVDHLIEAFAIVHRQCPAAHLYIVGDGPFRAAYEERAVASGAGDVVHFTGHLSDPREVLANADIFALASLREPFGLVVSEAREMGCALVTTDIDGLPEAVGGRNRALLVPPADPVAMATALLSLVNDPALLAHYRAASAADTRDLTVAVMAEATFDVYREVAG
jgi:glycosyltransferase involved in cell wall biosynthesis